MKYFSIILYALVFYFPLIVFSQKNERTETKRNNSMINFYDAVLRPSHYDQINIDHFIVFRVKSPNYSGTVIISSEDWYNWLFELGFPNSKNDSIVFSNFKKAVVTRSEYHLSAKEFDSLKFKLNYVPKKNKVLEIATDGEDSILKRYFIWDEHYQTYNLHFNISDEEKNAIIFRMFNWGYFMITDSETGVLMARKIR